MWMVIAEGDGLEVDGEKVDGEKVVDDEIADEVDDDQVNDDEIDDGRVDNQFNDVQVADDNEVAVGVGLPLAVQVDGTQLSYEPPPGFFSSHKIAIFVS